MTKKIFFFFFEGSNLTPYSSFSIFKTFKRRQKLDGLKRPKTPTQTHSQTHGQTRGQTQIQAGLNAQGTHFEPVYSWR